MRLLAVKKIPLIFLGSLLVFCFSLVAAASADTRPYFKAYGADVFAGGWFNVGTGACNTAPNPVPGSNYQDDRYAVAPPNVYGGIQAFAKESAGLSNGGASSQYGAFALGTVESSSAPKGYYSSGATAPTTKDLLTFANNDPANTWGGKFQGSVRQAHCIPDYYGTRRSGSILTEGVFPTASSSYQAVKTGAPFNLNTSSTIINTGKNITIFIDGNVYIGNNIAYDVKKVDLKKTADIPKFALVVLGDIFIGPNVTQLDGFYIAQPHDPELATSVATGDGIIWTCHPNDTAVIPSNFPNTCFRRLVINGGVVAKQVNLLRTGGSDVATAATAEDKACAVAVAGGSSDDPACANVAEVFNYSPAMAIGGPFFSSTPGGSGPSYKIKSLINLPPVF